MALSFPTIPAGYPSVAIPLRMLAEWWVAYSWPFVAADYPLLQGQVALTAAGPKHDMAFRPALTELRSAWERFLGMATKPAEGFYLRSELGLARRQPLYPASLLAAHAGAVRAIAKTPAMPIRDAGPPGAQWSVFPKPQMLKNLREPALAVPGTQPQDVCLLVPAALWRAFQGLSVWIGALCIHEWCLFTETIEQAHDGRADRGDAYRLPTARPDNRRPLTWERNQIAVALAGGAAELGAALRDDLGRRCAAPAQPITPALVTDAVIAFIGQVAALRNPAHF